MPDRALPDIEHVLHTGDADAGERLDRLLARLLPDTSRTRAQALVREGLVTSGGRTIGEPGHRVKPGETLRVVVPAPVSAEPEAQPIPLDVVYEDAHLVVVDKPAGMVVHPGAGNPKDTLVNALIAHCGASLSGIGGVARPGIVHRLDKDTSGLLVVAKSDIAHRGLAEQFQAHGRDGRLVRSYLAVVWGAPVPSAGRVDAALARSVENRTKIAVSRSSEARHAVTHYATLAVHRDPAERPIASLLRCHLETGRTHQIRVHMAHIGHPLLGDDVYGANFRTRAARLPEPARVALTALGRQALHAAELGFVHPVSGKAMLFTAPPPDDLDALIGASGLR
jgi:23S rRNA pseudouridine1911/1915/1917 synthase